MPVELRHLRCFIAVANELSFARAAEKLHIEQSPLSRTIKELESRLGVLLFHRDRRGTRLTQAGKAFLQDVPRVFAALEQATQGAKAVAAGSSGVLRLGLSDGAAQPRLAALLALCREEEPRVEIRLSEVPLAEQVRGLRNDTFDAGFARSDSVGDDIEAYPLWREPLVVAVPSRHPLLAHSLISTNLLLQFPLILCDPDVCEGYCKQVDQVLRAAGTEPRVAERARTLQMMLTLVAAGYGVALVTAEQIAACRHPDIVVRQLDAGDAALTTYLLTKAQTESPQRLESFVSRAISSAQQDLDLLD